MYPQQVAPLVLESFSGLFSSASVPGDASSTFLPPPALPLPPRLPAAGLGLGRLLITRRLAAPPPSAEIYRGPPVDTLLSKLIPTIMRG